MIRKASLNVLFVAFLTFLAGCQAAAPDTNRATTTNSAASETIDTAAIEAELIRIEKDWPRVMREKDGAAVRKLEADDSVFIYPDGSIGGKTQDVADIESGALSAESIEMVDLKVNVLNKDAAIVSGRSIVKNGKYRMPDGKSLDITGQYRFIDTFARRNGEWKLVSAASVPVRQPPAESPASSGSPVGSPGAKAAPATASPKASPSAKPSATP